VEWAAYFDERTETMPPAWTRRLEEELLVDQVTRCFERSPFWRRKLAGAGVRPEHVLGAEDLRRIPLTTKEELRASQEAEPPLGDFVCADPVDVVRVHLTSGTTGKPLALGYTAEDLRTSARIGARAFWAAGARPDDVLLHCLNYSFYTGGLVDHDSLEETGATMVPVGLGQSTRLLELWEDLRPTALFSTLTYPLYLAETAEERGLDPCSLGLRKLLVAGEPGGQLGGTRKRLETRWGASMRDTYGLSDVWGTFAAECDEGDGLHFCGQDGVLVELIDPGSGDPVGIEPGATGELVFTHLAREASPVLRFRSRDLAEILDAECPCGRTGFRFRVAGRSDDMFRVRGVNVFPSSLEGLLREHGLDRFAVILERFPVEPPVEVLVEGVDGREGELARAVKERLGFTCIIRAATLPRTEAKAKRLYRVYEGEERPA
jgi:phenylacetate-CoA ligase